MNIYDDAHKLARSLKESEEYKDYAEKSNKVFKDKKNKEMVLDFKKKALEFQIKQASEDKIDAGEEEEIKKLQDILMLNPDIKDFFISEMKFSQIVADVYKIIEDAINIKEE
ncbi:YlbF family regulator [Sporanaerobacter sp. PP17-6a]|jgi:cell fate (sporulation/competence/biofilm development) regulator YlbF (YheA/YmcA/DUF963 family)|uniref:YlbF family regulator n=1 Tax=Sporanaerobacter sp. PP17-6a TaxID=1891289 RepID=UPI00089FD81B|nr:YlbF family regulator [Sporanaerobacter sp. PP17-6a]MBE6081856.1 YlbF family regulator [Tissierellaceae bacterium]SCL84951.1 hypothetical protein PP176A_0755 [Sporanaerobacter sp. PP17-6a]